jgi:hypothetical protein
MPANQSEWPQIWSAVPVSSAEPSEGDSADSFEGAATAVPIEQHPGWVAFLTFSLVDDDVVLVDLQVGYGGLDWQKAMMWAVDRLKVGRPCPDVALPPGGLSAKVIRGVKWGDLVREARIQLAVDTGLQGVVQDLTLPSWRKQTKRQPGRRRKSSEVELECAEIALRYTQLLGTRHIIRTIAKERGMREKAVANRVERARVLGFLTRSKTTRAGGSFTAKGKETLSGKH